MGNIFMAPRTLSGDSDPTCTRFSWRGAVRNAVAMAYRFAANRFIERVEQDIAAAAVSHS